MFREFNYDTQPVVEIVNEIIADAVKNRASDIHFDPTPDKLKVRMRIDGDLVDYAYVPEVLKKNLTTRIKIISGMNITESRLPQDGAIKTELDGRPLDMRVSSLPIVDGEKVVIRVLDYSTSLKGIENIGISDVNLEKIKRMLDLPNGIILTTGATGSGKSTTTYAMLSELNKPEINIITVEDPVEMKIEGLNQVQTMSEIGLTFAAALRSILRQDPDVIMIGEIRDDETARIAVRSAITGHLVVSTIHTNNALNTIERLLDMDIERYLLGTAISGIISQRLAKMLCTKCRGSRPATPYEKLVIRKAIGIEIDNLYTAIGCPECIGGYRGRIPVHEVLEVDQEIKDAITNNTPKEELRHIVYGNGKTITLLQDGLKKVVNGLTSFEEILRIIDIESDFGDDTDGEMRLALMGKLDVDENGYVIGKPKEEQDADAHFVKITLPANDNVSPNTIEQPVIEGPAEEEPVKPDPTPAMAAQAAVTPVPAPEEPKPQPEYTEDGYEIPTEEALSINQGAFGNLDDISLDDFDFDDDDE